MYNYVRFLLLPKELSLDSFPSFFFMVLTLSFSPGSLKMESTLVCVQLPGVLGMTSHTLVS